jgi:hypothetical protein
MMVMVIVMVMLMEMVVMMMLMVVAMLKVRVVFDRHRRRSSSIARSLCVAHHEGGVASPRLHS